MCRAKPFPRCSNHARKALQSARKSGNAERIEKAQYEFDRSLAGIELAKSQGRIEDAKKFSIERETYIDKASFRKDQETAYLRFTEGHDTKPLTDKQSKKFITQLKEYSSAEDFVMDYYEDSIRSHTLQYGTPLVARTRVVFLDKDNNQVIKIPLTSEGEMSNYREAKYSSSTEETYIKVASCSMVKDGEVEVLHMEHVVIEPNPYGENMPDWVKSVDCGQVGYNSKGELVAYDL